MPSTLESTIREAVATGAYAKANVLISAYCKQLETADELLRAKGLLDWMLQRTSAARAQDATTLKELLAAIEYRRLPCDRLHTWQIDG